MSQLSDSESGEELDNQPSFGQIRLPIKSIPMKTKRAGKRTFDKVGDGGEKKEDKEDDNEDDDMGAAKYIKTGTQQEIQQSVFAMKMMQKMGYKEGSGLGKHSQGRKEIVEASHQRGRRGLGLRVEGFEPADIEWDFEKEKVILEEEIAWIPPSDGKVPPFEEMQSWKVVGQKKLTIDDETIFCDERVLKNILASKSVFDNLEGEEMRKARTKSNPYETIRGAFFLNRAAMKMANMDAMFDFMFTNPVDDHGKSVVGPNELLYFADICAGPGGFSEYVLWRRKGDSKGFGLTLRGQNDFKLEDFFAGPSEMFEPHYGVGGLEGNGDIFRPQNQEAFINFVLNNTDGKGAHFCMADGGFSVEGQENIQEILSKQLYLCQFLVAVGVIREGGHFVCKLFDLFTPFSVGLVYLMRLIFKQVCICKPVTSRPANSERYIVCKSLRPNKGPVLKYMDAINQDLCRLLTSVSTTDINHIVPLQTLQDDAEFFTYIYNSNVKLGKIQILNLRKIQAFAQNVNLYEKRQSEVRRKCLEKWLIPDEVRTAPSRPDPWATFHELVPDDEQDDLKHLPLELNHSNLDSIESVYDYMCAISGDNERTFMISCGKKINDSSTSEPAETSGCDSQENVLIEGWELHQNDRAIAHGDTCVEEENLAITQQKQPIPSTPKKATPLSEKTTANTPTLLRQTLTKEVEMKKTLTLKSTETQTDLTGLQTGVAFSELSDDDVSQSTQGLRRRLFKAVVFKDDDTSCKFCTGLTLAAFSLMPRFVSKTAERMTYWRGEDTQHNGGSHLRYTKALAMNMPPAQHILFSCYHPQLVHFQQKRSVVFCLDRRTGRWRKPEQVKVELPTRTLLEVEFVTELRGEGKGQRKVTTVHVMDALFLCGKDVRHRHFRERMDQVQKFVKALHKETRSDLARLVMPDVFKLEEAAHVFDRLEMKLVKGSGNQPRLCFHSHTGNFYHPSGINFVKMVKEPWTMALSKTQQKKYWFNKRQPNSATFECHHDSIATFRDCKVTALRWTWSPGVRVHKDQSHKDESLLSKDEFVAFIQKKLK